jgi:hypothetical protein
MSCFPHFQSLFVRLTGHRAAGPSAAMDDYGGLTKIGAAIALAASLCGLNFGAFAWVLSDGLKPVEFRGALIGAAVVLGMALVLVVDRAAVYFADTPSAERRWRAIWSPAWS